MQTSLTIQFGDGEYKFRLGLKQINEIQIRGNAGIGAIFARVAKGRYFKKTELGEVAIGDHMEAAYRYEDITTTIRQGLLGGGIGTVEGVEVKVDEARADQLLRTYVLAEDCEIEKSWTLAYAILTATIIGYEPPNGAGFDKKKAETTAA